MKKIFLAVALGAVLGVVDGASAWFTPDARDQLGSIVLWSAVKDVMAGFTIGLAAVWVKDKRWVAAWGLLVGLGLAYLVAMSPDPETGRHYYLAIMVPGGLVGLLVGYLTARYGSGTGEEERREPATA